MNGLGRVRSSVVAVDKEVVATAAAFLEVLPWLLMPVRVALAETGTETYHTSDGNPQSSCTPFATLSPARTRTRLSASSNDVSAYPRGLPPYDTQDKTSDMIFF